MFLESLVRRLGQLFLQPAHGCVAVLEIARHRPLAAVEVERSHAVPGRGERDRGVDRGRRLARSALFVGEDDEMWLTHGLPLGLIFSHGAPRAPPTRRLTERGLGCKSFVPVKNWHAPVPNWAVHGSRWCQRWGRSTRGTWRWSKKRSGAPTRSPRRSSSIRRSLGRARISPAIHDRRSRTAGC